MLCNPPPVPCGRHVLYSDYRAIPRRVPADLVFCDPPWSITSIGFDNAGFNVDALARYILYNSKPNAWIFLFGTLEIAATFLSYFRFKFPYVWLKPQVVITRPTTKAPAMAHETIYAFIRKDLDRMGRLYMDKYALRTKGEPYTRTKQRGQTEYEKAYGHSSDTFTTVNTGYREGKSVLEYNPKSRMPVWERTKHPTQKPLALMRYLIRGYCPPGGVVLDPCAGSGTAMMAAEYEGMTSVNAELSLEYRGIIRGRWGHTLNSYTAAETDPRAVFEGLDPSDERAARAEPQGRPAVVRPDQMDRGDAVPEEPPAVHVRGPAILAADIPGPGPRDIHRQGAPDRDKRDVGKHDDV